MFSSIIKNNKIKIFGLAIIKFKVNKKGITLKIFGIPVYKFRNKLSKLIADVSNNLNFDMKEFDNRINDLVFNCKPDTVSDLDKHKIAYIATDCYDNGGHSKCINDLSKSLKNIYNQKLYITNNVKISQTAPITFNQLKENMEIELIDNNIIMFNKVALESANKIIEYAPKILLVYIHPNDILGTAILSIIKRCTDIKIIFFNHASHYPSLGMNFADLILEGMPTTEKVTHEKRHLTNTQIIGLQSLPKEDTKYYTEMEKQKLKQALGIQSNNLVTMSGGAAYKFFEQDIASDYFEMIKRILTIEKNLIHVVITELNEKEEKLVNNIFDDKELKQRLKFVPYQANFDQYFQLADVFIDSFPVSSALTQLDLMRNKVASVVKINTETPYYSFHEYQKPNYPYMFEKVEDMEKAICELLHDKLKRQNIIDDNYQYWLKTYESNVVRDKYIKIIEGI